MSDPTLCRGKDADGNQCICMRCKETYVDDTTHHVLCTNCGHIESAHPEPKPSVGTFIKSFRDAAKVAPTSISAKVSLEDAEAETSAGLRTKKRKSAASNSTDTEPPSKKASKGGKGKAKEKTRGEIVKYGKLDGDLRNPKIPSVEELGKMRHAGMVVLSTPDQPLSIDTNWSCKDARAQIKDLLPKAIDFLDRHPFSRDRGESSEIRKQVWLACVKTGKHLVLSGDPLPAGVELADHCKSLGRPISDRVLYLVSKTKIPERRWDWADSESEDLGSEIDPTPSEDIIHVPRKPVKPRPKVKPEPNLKIKSEPGVKIEDNEDNESDMRKAAKNRTRLSTGTIKRKPLFIPGSSDGFEEPDAGQPAIVISDDDDLTPPPAPTLASMISTSGLSTWTLAPQSPSSAPQSPNKDPPSFYDDFPTEWPSPPDHTAYTLPFTGSSSFARGSSSFAASSFASSSVASGS
ncbi:hypothetical protein C8R44DRAFT_894234 [Mycena epipterygia]|nr:hypothetical protein C8R44DRAFT_894234 [Mycena epipterygia]